MPHEDWEPRAFDPHVPSVARMYNYFLGGAHNFGCDRDLARQIEATLPDAGWIARQNRGFVIRAVTHLAGEGYDQFIDVGCGIPGAVTVHHAVQSVNPAARVVYVDTDPIVLALTRQIVRDHNLIGVGVVDADARRPVDIFMDPSTRELIDLANPVVVVLAAVMHFVPDSDDPASVMANYWATMPYGSALVFSHGTAADDDAPASAVRELYQARTDAHGAVTRSRSEVSALLGGFEVSEPGVTWVTDWYPGPELRLVDDGPRSHLLGAVAKVPW